MRKLKGTGVSRRRKVVTGIIAAVVVLAIIGAISSRKKDKGKTETVRIEELKKGELTELVSAPGEIEPKTTVQISAKVSARIVAMPYDEGGAVTKGDLNANPPIPASVLVQLDAKDLASQLRLAEASRAAQAAETDVEKSRIESQKANLASLASTLQQAQRDLERKKGLFETKDISEATYDEVRSKVEQLAAQHLSTKHSLDATERNLVVIQHNLEAADARIAQAKETLSFTTITSPIDGVVTRLNAKVGEMVMTGTMNNPGTVIMEVSDLSKMLVVAQVDEADVEGLEVGQEAIVSVQAFPDIEFRGKVDEIALKHRFSETRTRYYRTEILLENDPNVARLYTGLTAHVDIKTRKHGDVLKVPSQAVLAREVDSLPVEIRDKSAELDKNKTFATVVFRYVDGKAIATPVKIGPSDLTHTIVEAGLNEGDKVIVGPYKALEKLAHDQKVKDEREVEKEKKDKKNGGDANKVQ